MVVFTVRIALTSIPVKGMLVATTRAKNIQSPIDKTFDFAALQNRKGFFVVTTLFFLF